MLFTLLLYLGVSSSPEVEVADAVVVVDDGVACLALSVSSFVLP